jgi:hypothetical protein
MTEQSKTGIPCLSLANPCLVERVFSASWPLVSTPNQRCPFAVSQCLCRVLMEKQTLQRGPIMARSQSKSFVGPRCFRGNAWGPIARPPATSGDCRTAKLQPGHGAMILLTSASRVPARSGRPFSRCFLGTALLFSRAAMAEPGFSSGDNHALAIVEARNASAARGTCLSLSSQVPEIISSQGFAGGADKGRGCECFEKCIRPMRSRFKILFSARVFDFDPLIRSRSSYRCRELRAF